MNGSIFARGRARAFRVARGVKGVVLRRLRDLCGRALGEGAPFAAFADAVEGVAPPKGLPPHRVAEMRRRIYGLPD